MKYTLSIISPAVLCMAAVLALPHTSKALSWVGDIDGGWDSGTPGSDTNWTGDVAFTTLDFADFSAVSTTIDTQSDQILTGIRLTNLSTDAVTIQNNTLTFSGTPVLDLSCTVQKQVARPLTIDSNIANNIGNGWNLAGTGADGTIINGTVSGTLLNVYGSSADLELNGDNTFTGDLTFRPGGTLKLGHANGLGAASNTYLDGAGSAVDLNGQQNVPENFYMWANNSINTIKNTSSTEAILDGDIYTRNTLAYFSLDATSGNLTVNGDIQPAAAGVDQMRITGAGTVTLNGDNSAFDPESSTGIFILNSANIPTRLKLGSATAAGDTDHTIRVGNAIGYPTLDLGGQTLSNPVLLSEDTSRLADSSDTGAVYSGTLTLTNNADRSVAFEKTGAGELEIASDLTGTADKVILTGVGVVNISGDNSALTLAPETAAFEEDYNQLAAGGTLKAGSANAFKLDDGASGTRDATIRVAGYFDYNGFTLPNTIKLVESGSYVTSTADGDFTIDNSFDIQLSNGQNTKSSGFYKDGADVLDVTADLTGTTASLLVGGSGVVQLSGDNTGITFGNVGQEVIVAGTTGTLRLGNTLAAGAATNVIRVGQGAGNAAVDLNGLTITNPIWLSEDGSTLTDSSDTGATYSSTLTLTNNPDRGVTFSKTGAGALDIATDLTGTVDRISIGGTGIVTLSGDNSALYTNPDAAQFEEDFVAYTTLRAGSANALKVDTDGNGTTSRDGTVRAYTRFDYNGFTLPNTIKLTENYSMAGDSSGADFTIDNTFDIEFSNNSLTRGTGFFKDGAGVLDVTMDLSGVTDRIFIGGNGITQLSGDNSGMFMNTPAEAITIWQGATLRLNHANAAGFTTNGIRIGFSNLAGTLDVNGRTVVNPIMFAENAATITNSNATTATISSDIALHNVGSNSITSTAGDITISGAVGRTGTVSSILIANTDTATLRMTGANFIPGELWALSKLMINGDSSASTGILVGQTNGLIGGTGTWGGDLHLNGVSSAVAPGDNAIGTLTIGGDVTLAGRTMSTEVDGTSTGTADVLAVTGELDLGDATLDITELVAADDAAYVIATYGTLAGSFATKNIPSGYIVDYAYSGNQIALVQGTLTPYESYMDGYGLNPSGNGAADQDPDGDKLKNIFEYMLGLDPSTVDSDGAVFETSLNGSDQLVITYERNAANTANLSSVGLQGTNDLSVAPTVLVNPTDYTESTDSGTPVETITITTVKAVTDPTAYQFYMISAQE